MSPAAASSDTDGSTSVWQDEAALLHQVAEGHRAASRTVVDRYLAPIHRFAFRLLGDRAEAEDVAQETFLRLWRQAPRWKPKAKVSTWLYQVARNLCVDRLRARQTRQEAAPPNPPESAPNGASLLERRQLSERVQGAVAQLPERQRMALVLVHFQGLGNIEAAAVMEVKVEALESLLARARRQLRKRLRPIHQEDRNAPGTAGDEMMHQEPRQPTKGRTA
jgi:RNA polymerase sigma-70 factor (ECF subfamily)